MKKEEKRFQDEFLTLFDDNLKLIDIEDIFNVRNTFETDSFNLYLMNIDESKRLYIFNKVISFLMLDYITRLNIDMQLISSNISNLMNGGVTYAFAKLKNKKSEIKYLTISDNIFKINSNESDFILSIGGYVKHDFLGTIYEDNMIYGGIYPIDYYFFECLNLTDTFRIEDVFEGELMDIYKLDSINFNVKNDQKFIKIPMKDFHNNELFDKDIMEIQFKGESKFRTILNYNVKENRCLVSRIQIGLYSDILTTNIWSDIIELKKIN